MGADCKLNKVLRWRVEDRSAEIRGEREGGGGGGGHTHWGSFYTLDRKGGGGVGGGGGGGGGGGRNQLLLRQANSVVDVTKTIKGQDGWWCKPPPGSLLANHE